MTWSAERMRELIEKARKHGGKTRVHPPQWREFDALVEGLESALLRLEKAEAFCKAMLGSHVFDTVDRKDLELLEAWRKTVEAEK